MRTVSRTALAACSALLATLSALGAGPSILPFDQVNSGMRGVGRTVFSGTTIETFEVEIVGKLDNTGPDQNLILGRLSGGPLAHTGVLSGMSGSPVYIDGKLIGAVAYSWGFAKEPIAGITPIEEMLRVAALDSGGGLRAAAGLAAGPALSLLRNPSRIGARLSALAARAGGGAPPGSRLPLAVSGLGPLGLARADRVLETLGLLPLQAGGAGRADGPALELEPGSAVGIKLVRGDVDMTATGTVTWVDGDAVLAFGHPLFGLGSIDLPMTGAHVETLLPSVMQSARIATPTAEVGAMRQDRSVAVAGVVGATPQMIPVRVRLQGAEKESAFSFDLADDPLLSPLLLYATLNGILAGQESAFGSPTIRLREGSVIKLLDHPDVLLDNVFAGPTAFEYGTGISAYALYLLMNNTWAQPQIVGVNLLFEYDEAPLTARIERAVLDRYRAAPGQTVALTVALSPYRGPERQITREFVIPEETPPGELRLTIGGALALTRETESDEPLMPRDLEQLIWLINNLRRNDRIYVLATREDAGVLLRGARLPNLPPSVATLLTRPWSPGNFATIPRRAVLEEVVATDSAIEGVARVRLQVEAP